MPLLISGKQKINSFFNVNLEDRDIYTVFEMLGIKKDRKQKNGREFYVFHKNDVEPKL